MQTLSKTLTKAPKPTGNISKTLVKPPKRAQTIIKQPYKYTEQFVSNELDDMLAQLSAQEQIKTKTKLFEDKPYSTKKFSQWRAKYSTSKRIDEKLQKIDDILEARLLEQGLTGKNFPFVIFLLKNHYGYQDKREVETETTHVFKVTRGTQTPVKSLQDRIVIDTTPIDPKQSAQPIK